MKKRKKDQGITLIALVITIIVLLILAAVSIATLTGENGLLVKAQQAQEKTIKAQIKEEIEISIIGLIDNNGNLPSMEATKEKLESSLEVSEIVYNGKDEISGEYKDHQFTIKYENGNYEVNVGDKITGEKPEITYTVDTEEVGVEQVTITVTASVKDGTIVNIIKPNEEIEENTNMVSYTVYKNGKYTFLVKSSTGRTARCVVYIKNIRPSEPIIQLEGGYPIITPNGIQETKAKVTIIYDDNDALENTYSEDNGNSWKKYSGSFQPNSNTIIAKSAYKENSDIKVETQKSVIPSDAIEPEYYDGSTSYFGQRKFFKICGC